MEKGLVTKSTGSWYSVVLDSDEVRQVRIKGKLRLQGIRTTNPVAVGDNVMVDGESIVSVCDRRNYIIRKASNLSKQSQIIACNIDLALLVVTVRHPETAVEFIDRFLATAEAYRIPVLIAFNKTDLLSDGDLEYVDGLEKLYTMLGYSCVRTSVVNGEGMERLRSELSGRITLLSGNSGVGKSSIINALDPSFNTRTGAISDVHDTGMHTTTFSEMLPFAGGYVIDTPGVKGFGTIEMAKEEVGHFFPEIFRFSQSCRFGNCTHTNEPGCAVRDAVEKHYISESRYTSYLSILDDSDDSSKYR